MVHMIDSIANVFLSLTHDQFIIPLIILGYIWINRDTFYHATCLILVSMIFNCALKVTFQMPLSAVIGKEGFAFPSGHMLSATIFFGWLAFRSGSLAIRTLIIVLLTGIGLSLIHFQYHNYYDVLGAIFFALLQMVAYYQLATKKNSILRWSTIFVSTILVIYIYLKFRQIVSHIWMAYYALIGFILSEKIFLRVNIPCSVLEKIVRTIICFSSVCGIVFIFSNEIFLNLPIFIANLKWLLIGFVVPYTSQLTWVSKGQKYSHLH